MLVSQSASLLTRLFGAIASICVFAGCAPTRAMCRLESECGKENSCVAGRCQSAKGHARIQSSRRVRVSPKRIDCGAVGERVAMCPTGEPLAVEFEFELALKPQDDVVEAYLNVCLSAPPADLIGHAEDSPQVALLGSTPARRRRPSRDLGLARTRLHVGEPACPVRLDVLELVRKWRTRSNGEGTLVVMWEGPGAGGTQVALQSDEPASDLALELYVR